MNPGAMYLGALLLLAAVGLVIWAWATMARVEEDLRSMGGFEGMHFDIGPQAAERSEGTR